ncbi:uncharacterized protein LOC128221318 isoform X2 [Mya arenaria]|uniref:uncharacterized protein LOC128221318 isoform X2 n=1 Tax=Mya arenaria TaxID=6604 RepID=UPI0022E15CEC|nr:uncharacterized protein LOC128221318 isoform X2 [Mya arenaria]
MDQRQLNNGDDELDGTEIELIYGMRGGLATEDDPFGEFQRILDIQGLATEDNPFGGQTTEDDPFGEFQRILDIQGLATEDDPFGEFQRILDIQGLATEDDPFGELKRILDIKGLATEDDTFGDADGNAPHLRKAIMKFEADLNKPAPHDPDITAARVSRAYKSYDGTIRSLSSMTEELEAERTSLLEKCNEKKARDDPPVEEILYPRINYIEEKLRCAYVVLEILGKVFNILFLWRRNLKIQKLRSELHDRLELLRQLKTIICLLYALLNKIGGQDHGSQCDMGTIQILLIRSGVEANPGPPRHWKDLLTTEQNLGILSSHIGKCWQYYSDRLGLIEEDRDVIVAKYPESTQLQIYHMLKQAARLPHNQNMGTMLTLLEKCAEEFVDMRVDWDMIEYYFADAVGIAEEPSNERDGKGGPSSRGLKRKLNIQSGEMSVKIQRV